MRFRVLSATVVATACVTTAQADFIGLDLLDTPDILAGFIDTSYDANTDAFLASGFALEIDFDGSPPSPIAAGSFLLTATINNVGDVLGGTLAVDGMVDGFGPSLLTGSLDDIGWDDNGGTLLEFLFTVTGGMLAGDYGGNGSQFGVILNLGSGMYTGDWRDSFATTSSSGTADIAPIPGPGALAAFAVAGGLIRRRRRSV
ncbi:MAG: hypothetical protein KDA25_05240 [Phycisphaerales bacterium]|nr:hypothetical protein [Phycisphaerales bacterium]